MGEERTIEQILEQEGMYISTTQGVSMEPLFRTGRDTIVVLPPTGRLQKYDVPLYRRGEAYILHRVVEVLPDCYTICGDNCITLEKGITDDQIIGVLTEFYRKNKHVKVTDPAYLRYARVWVALYPVRALLMRGRRKAGRLYRKVFPRKPQDHIKTDG